MDYKRTAAEVVKDIGGKENVSHFEHCSTRLRFSLYDNDKADVEKLQQIPGVLTVKMGAQCQVVIGNEVVEVYNEVIKVLDGTPASSEGSNNKPKQKQKLGAKLLDFLVGVFQPLIPAIAGGGVLKSLLLLLAVMGVLDKDTETYQILNMVGDAPLYFLPLLVAVTTANKLKVNSLVALSAVSALLLPGMTTMLSEGGELFGFGLQNITYAYQVFPAILTILLYAQVEKFFTRISPKAIRIFFVPLMSLVITVPISLLVLGPLGYTFGEGFAGVILTLYDYVGWVAVAILAAVLPFMVATGMHKAMLPYAISTYSATGKEALYLPASLAHNLAESGACFAVAIRTKDKALKATAISAGISALFGITEPALYGVTIQNKKVLTSVMIGAFVGGAFIGIIGIQAYVIVGPGLASMSMFISEDLPRNIIYASFGLVISFVVAFVVAFFLSKEKEGQDNQQEPIIPQNTGIEFKSPVVGQQVPLNEVKDDVFSSKVMGDGIAVIPSKGELYAPVDGAVKMVFETNHALGIETANGAEMLFHVGIDTVQLEGKYFEPQVTVGDNVKAGDLLLRFDVEKIIEEGYDPVTIGVITNKDKFDLSIKNQKGHVDQTNTIMVVTKLGE
ncbi:beta-glucoside-specific PTS transporter subunit IIABC [Oceanobacillus picturae]|uniref:beta-glucoside-specific PTS transporter subunit IIABC n=1 Tax=Oceanobacillus picturae TaxID=171693 RepID=UPI0036341FE5